MLTNKITRTNEITMVYFTHLDLERGSCWRISLHNFPILIYQELLKVPLYKIPQKSSSTRLEKLINWCSIWSININLSCRKHLENIVDIHVHICLCIFKMRIKHMGAIWHALSKIGKSALNLVQANCLISEFDPGSCPPN